MLRTAMHVLLVLLAGYAVLVLALYLAQDRLLYHPTQSLPVTPADRGMPFEAVTFETEDGEVLHGWWLPVEPERGALLFFHGNAGNIAGRLESAAQFLDLGLSVLIFDYRGYGQSTGAPSEEGLYRDAEAAWRYLTQERDRAPQRVVLFGRSLGSGPVTWLAARRQAGALILESAFTSVPDVAARQFPLVPVRWLARTQFDNRRRIPHVEVPLLVIHSPDDAVIPFVHGRRLYEAARSPKSFLRLTGGHNDGFLVSAPQYHQGLDAFLTRHLRW